jgi:hypothetical protein
MCCFILCDDQAELRISRRSVGVHFFQIVDEVEHAIVRVFGLVEKCLDGIVTRCAAHRRIEKLVLERIVDSQLGTGERDHVGGIFPVLLQVFEFCKQ